MPRSRLERIREKIRLQQYDMSVHAVEEMAEDNLDITDVEHAVLTGRILCGSKGITREGINMRSRDKISIIPKA